MTNATVIRVNPSFGVTKAMADNYGKFTDDNRDMAVKISDGNPGAMRYLMEINDHFLEKGVEIHFDTLYFRCKDNDLLGHKFYTMIKERDTSRGDGTGVQNTVDNLYKSGWLS